MSLFSLERCVDWYLTKMGNMHMLLFSDQNILIAHYRMRLKYPIDYRMEKTLFIQIRVITNTNS
jgi:hypothetical protein